MTRARILHLLLLVVALTALQACDDASILLGGNEIDPAAHLTRDDYTHLRYRDAVPAENANEPPIPSLPAPAAPSPPKPGSGKLVSITVTDSVPLRDVLVELARDAGVNVEIDPHVQGGVIFSAHNQPFDVVLHRICAMAGLRATTEGSFIHIEPDSPYQETYQLDYLSLSRKSTSEVAIATNVFDTDVAGGSLNGASGSTSTTSHSSDDNNSTAKISAASESDFWGEVNKSLTQIMAAGGHGDKGPGTFSIDRNSGMVTVYGSSRQHQTVAEYFRLLKRKVYAQVLIDARVIEVELDDGFQSGINWATLFGGSFNAAANFGSAAGAPMTAGNVFAATVDHHDFSSILTMMRSFGTTRVLSAPRLTVLNNQTAVLKVATNQVYFVTQAQFTTVTNANGATVTTTPVYTSTPHTVPVGLVMTVQPAIDVDHGRVTMTLRPTISRVVDQVNDPSIGLNAAAANVSNPVQSQIPVLAVREMDSVLQVKSGDIAVLGGLMQDSSTNTENGLPPFDTIPGVSALAKNRDSQGKTSELVILLRATITDTPPPDGADQELYHHYNNDPRPMTPASFHNPPAADLSEDNPL